MKKRLLSLLLYSVFWLLFFFFARLFFLITQAGITGKESISGLAGTFSHGILLDISTTGYYLMLPFLLMIPALYFAGKWYPFILRCYTYLLIIFSSLIIVADASLYSYWGFRMDYTPVFYLRTPGEAMASVSTFKLIILLLSVVTIAALFIWIFEKLVHRFFRDFERTSALIPSILVFLVLTAALIIPIRGGVGIAPINAGTVYFSNKMFLNHAAINAVWNVGTTAFTQKPVENPYRFSEDSEADAIFSALSARKDGLRRNVLKSGKPNVLMIILESFSAYVVGATDGDPLVTPCFNRIATEGILFKNFYASGTRTDKAMPAILSGYPAQPAQSIIKEPKKSQSLPNLVKTLVSEGYRSAFWYGGDINFANFNSFIIGSGFNTVITQENFKPEYNTSKWGVHDHLLFEALKDSMGLQKEPFVYAVLTLSSHEPYDVPMKPVFTEGERVEYRNSVFYTDSVMGAFIDWAKMQSWWENTLIVLVADHGSRGSEEIPAYSPLVFRIPMVWTGGAVKEKGMIVEKIGSQVDISLTILDQLGIKADFPFAKDLFSASSPSFAFYTFNEGFGFITDSSSVAYDHKPGKMVWEEGKSPEAAGASGKAYLQVMFNDYLKR